jgi:hypothetical protein
MIKIMAVAIRLFEPWYFPPSLAISSHGKNWAPGSQQAFWALFQRQEVVSEWTTRSPAINSDQVQKRFHHP